MALTFRTGSDGIGRALTINELDDNFRYFTGSHSITGSLTINGNITITGSIIPEGVGVHNIGSVDNPFNEVFVSSDSIIFVSGSTTSSFGVDSSGSMTGSFDGDLTGSFTGSGDGSFTGSFDGVFTGSIDGTEFYINNLPITEPAESGRLWLSGSAENSKYLMVRD